MDIESFCNLIFEEAQFMFDGMLRKVNNERRNNPAAVEKQQKASHICQTHMVSIVDYNLHQLHTHHNELMCRRQEVNLYGIKEGTPDFQLISDPNSNSTKCIKVHNLQKNPTHFSFDVHQLITIHQIKL